MRARRDKIGRFCCTISHTSRLVSEFAARAALVGGDESSFGSAASAGAEACPHFRAGTFKRIEALSARRATRLRSLNR